MTSFPDTSNVKNYVIVKQANIRTLTVAKVNRESTFLRKDVFKHLRKLHSLFELHPYIAQPLLKIFAVWR